MSRNAIRCLILIARSSFKELFMRQLPALFRDKQAFLEAMNKHYTEFVAAIGEIDSSGAL